MQILFVRSNKIGSRLIRWMTGEPCSHVAMRIGDNLVIHSKFSGVDIDLWSTFIKEYKLVHVLEPLESAVSEQEVIERLSLDLEGAQYDYMGILYFGIHLLFKKMGISIGKKNAWAKTSNYMCTELVGELVDEKDNSLLTPEELKDKLIKTGNWSLRKEI